MEGERRKKKSEFRRQNSFLDSMLLSDRCYAITGLGYSPPWCVNAGFVVGDRTTLIMDTGGNALAAATTHGYATAVRPANGLVVVDLEKHFDHIGGNSYFRERGIDVYGHAGIQRTAAEFQAEIEEFNGTIPNPARRGRREAEVFFSGTKLINPNRAITHDMRMDLGACEVEILMTPGHTPTNISVYVPSDGVLFCADALINGYLPNLDAGSVDDWLIWLNSLDRVAALAPRIVVPGHGPVAKGEEVPRVIESVREVLRQSIEAGRSPTS
jgi:glyoxylase-like metal-dependent hydrolase (beta-lactamase superfamily II)